MSIIGIGVAIAIFLVSALFRAPIMVGLLVSIPFASTAFATLGGSTPLIYTLFALMLGGSLLLRRTIMHEIAIVFARHPVAWLLLVLAIYAAATSVLLPRLFNGRTGVYIPIEGIITRMQLAPTQGNVTQTAYFLLGIFVFFSFSILLLRPGKLEQMYLALFAFVFTNTMLGWLDLGGKFAGIGDIYASIRTASYALLTDVEQSGFYRIVGAAPEASAYATMELTCLAFAYTYWRRTGSLLAQLFALQALLLLILSTSSTAYGGLGVLLFTATLSLLLGAIRGQLRWQDWLLLAGAMAALAAVLATILYNDAILQPFIDLFRTMVLEKGTSSSGLERNEWNAQGIQGFLDTYGIGIGFGSSRTSSWLISGISQLGFIGMGMMLTTIVVLIRGMGGITVTPEDEATVALCAAARACGLASLMAATITGSSADPGILYFICLATVVSCRASVQERHHLALMHRPKRPTIAIAINA